MTISIITVTYNNVEGLTKTLNSISNQINNNYESIVIDGFSNDGSYDVIKSYEQKIKNIKWISEKDNGIYDAMNKGIKMASGDYCLFLNAGDVFYDDSVIDIFLKHEITSDIIACNSLYLKSKFHEEKIITSPSVIKASDLILNFLPHQATFIKRKLFFDYHLYDTSYKIISDWLFFIECILVHNVSYRHIDLIVSSCETEGISSNPQNNKLMEDEFNMGLKTVLPFYYDDYTEYKKQINLGKSEIECFKVKFFNSKIGRLILKTRRILKRIGYYEHKNNHKQKIFFRKIIKEDNNKKKEIEKLISELPHNLLKCNNNDNDVVVSLTSYGKRVYDALPYALYSIFNQEQLPNRIVLYLDKENWNNNNLPKLIKRLQNSGLEVRFCEDIRSYKKLIPALIEFPNNPIITIDDDFYYNKSIIKELLTEYELSDKKTVIGSWGCISSICNGKYLPYTKWLDCKYGNKHSNYSLYAGNGTIYPPNIFDKEITKSDIFMKLCPTADDIWFWAMEKRQNIKIKLLKNAGYGLHVPVNRIETYDLNQKGTLFYENVINKKNDSQFLDVISYYNI